MNEIDKAIAIVQNPKVCRCSDCIPLWTWQGDILTVTHTGDCAKESRNVYFRQSPFSPDFMGFDYPQSL